MLCGVRRSQARASFDRICHTARSLITLGDLLTPSASGSARQDGADSRLGIVATVFQTAKQHAICYVAFDIVHDNVCPKDSTIKGNSSDNPGKAKRPWAFRHRLQNAEMLSTQTRRVLSRELADTKHAGFSSSSLSVAALHNVQDQSRAQTA